MATKKTTKKPAKQEKPKRGRPSKRTPAVEGRILAALADGIPMTVVCREPGMPDPSTVWDWEQADPAFSQAVARAREAGEDKMAMDCLEIADDARNDFMEKMDAEGNANGMSFNSEHVQRSKLRIETRLKLLACFNPRKYGQKQEINHKGKIGLEQLVAGEGGEE